MIYYLLFTTCKQGRLKTDTTNVPSKFLGPLKYHQLQIVVFYLNVTYNYFVFYLSNLISRFPYVLSESHINYTECLILNYLQKIQSIFKNKSQGTLRLGAMLIQDTWILDDVIVLINDAWLGVVVKSAVTERREEDYLFLFTSFEVQT